MGNSTLLTFDDRTRRFKRERKRMARGYKTVVRPDGLIVYRPKRSAFSFVKGLLWLVAGLIAFKAILYSYLGPISFGTRVDKLAEGTLFEQAGAWVMQADPATIYIANLMTTTLTMISG